jgi:hypothetical protein
VIILTKRTARKKSLIFLLLAASTSASAQLDPAVAARMKDISDRYNECVYSSAISRLGASNNDINLAVESSFASCATENAQMVLIMRQNGFSASQIESVLLEKKTGIKRELRKMVDEVRSR